MSDNTFKIKTSIIELHESWDSFSEDSIFLRKVFLTALEESTPNNVQNYYVEYFHDSDLIGIALFQYINLKNISAFKVSNSTIKAIVSSWALNTFASSILFIGNNMMSGQNAFRFSSKISLGIKYKLLNDAAEAVKRQLKSVGKKIHITVWKDFDLLESQKIENYISKKYYKFSIQPTMIFQLPASVKSESDYVNSLSKKYRDQYKRARKKSIGIVKHQLSVIEINQLQHRLSELYTTTVSNASFNTFHLPLDHFEIMKKKLGPDFQVYAYFISEKLIGFNTVVKNGNILEPYFLGYDSTEQKNRLLYLNMLYDIIGYAASKNFKSIAFGRTALEIKSSAGAKPVKLFGFIKHSNPLINTFIAKIFRFVEPKSDWKVRNPFKVDALEQQV